MENLFFKKGIEFYKNGDFEKAIEFFIEIPKDPSSWLEYYLYKGKLYYKLQQFGDAINSFNKVIEMDAHNNEAKTHIKMIYNILGISRNYYFENPYTDDSLYDVY